MPHGGFERPWSAVSRVLYDRGSIIICHAGTAVERESIAVFLPAAAFGQASRARDAFQRITQWHRAARPPSTK